MKPPEYKQRLIDACHALNNAEQEVYTAMINVAFAGIYKDVSEIHDLGEIIETDIASFEDTDDVNVQSLVELVKNIFKIKNTLINLNSLEIDFEG